MKISVVNKILHSSLSSSVFKCVILWNISLWSLINASNYSEICEPHEISIQALLIHAERKTNPASFHCCSLCPLRALPGNCVAVRLSEGSWDLVSGTFLLTTSEPFPLGLHLVMMQGGGHALTTSSNLLRDSAFCLDPCCSSRALMVDF